MSTVAASDTPFDDYIASVRADEAAAPTRQDGFYWINYGGRWEIAEYIDRRWYPCGWDSHVTDAASIKVIGPWVPPHG